MDGCEHSTFKLLDKVESCGCFVNVTSHLSVKSGKELGLNMLCLFREKNKSLLLRAEIFKGRIISGFPFLS